MKGREILPVGHVKRLTRSNSHLFNPFGAVV
jgi:hypothetical protein